MPCVPDAYSLSHLLGLVAGGGRLLEEPDRLALGFKRASPFVVSGAVASIVLVAPGRPVRWVRPPRRSADVLECPWSGWRELLPTELLSAEASAEPCPLTGWRRAVVEREPHAFVRGLLETAGLRVDNRSTRRAASGARVEYVHTRYLMTTPAAVPRTLLRAGCERIGVRSTQSGPRTVSIAERTSVELLDSFVGDPIA